MSSSAASVSLGSRRRIVTFLGKVLAFYVAWYMLYDLWLLPNGTVDEWLSLNVATVSTSLLEIIGFEVVLDERTLMLPGVAGIYIADGCNGLSTLGLFVGFVLAYPGSAVRRIWFIPFGIFVIYGTNVVRVMIMLLTQKYWPAAFGPLHGFGLTTIFYVVVFCLWVLWVNYGGSPSSSPSSDPESTQQPSPATSTS